MRAITITNECQRQIERGRHALPAILEAYCIFAMLVLVATVNTYAQGSRKDDIVFGPTGHPVGGATVRVCQASATGTPCAPLATLYTDTTLTVTAANPLQTDGIGNYHFYAPAGRYEIQITGPGIQGTMTYADVILPPDVSSTASGNNISAYGLTLGGNLTVAGNETINGTFATSTFSPSSLAITGNMSVAGPRPYIDVTATAYGADPTGVSDSTAAIQAAITAACNISIAVGRPGVFFPPGVYKVTQTQTGVSTTAPIFTTCAGLYLYGTGSLTGAGNAAQFADAPLGSEINVQGGASPNGAAVFGFRQQNGVTVENLQIAAWNQAISFYACNNVHVKHDSLTVQNTGQTDNTPLKITNAFWVWVEEGTLQTPTGTIPTMLLTGETPLSSEAPLVGLLFVHDMVTAGGGFEYIQRVNQTSAPGSFVFRNITQEDPAMAFLTVAEASSNMLGQLQFLTFDSAGQSDTTGGTAGYLVYNSTSGGQVEAVKVSNSGGALLNSNAANTTVPNNFLSLDQGFYNTNGLIGTQLLGGAEAHGFDIEAKAMNPSSPNTFSVDCSGFGSDCYQGVPALRFFENGQTYSTLGMDPYLGILFGGGNSQGYTAALQQNAEGDLDVLTTKLPAPTNLSGTATTGGSLAAGTYYGIMWVSSTTGSNACWVSSLLESSTVQAAAVTVSGANNAINFTWTAPAVGPTSPQTYCMQVTTSQLGTAGAPDQRVQQALGFAAPATNFLYTGQTQTFFGTTFLAQTILTPVHRFTYNSLGVNTTSPAYNLDVNGTARIATSLTLNGSAAQTAVQGSDMHLLSAGTVSGTSVLLCTDASGGATTSSCPSGGGGATIQTNGANNASQSTLNFTNPSNFNGLTFAFSNPSGGNETFSVGGTLNNAGITNAYQTINGQTCTLGLTCNVNSGAAHTAAINEGNNAQVAGVGPGNTGQVLVSQGSSADPRYIDLPQVYDVPAANCNNATAGAGWSIGSGGSVTCRAGTNNKGGYISMSDTSSTFATFQIAIPEDWDTATDPFIRFEIASSDTTSGHTIIPSIQVACYKGDGSTTDDVAPNAAHSLSTITTNTTNHQFWSGSNVQMNPTDMTGCAGGSLMQITVGRATDTATNAEFYGATVTFPRLISVQAN